MSGDFTSKSVQELRKMLVESGKYSQEEADNIKGKSKLVEAVFAINGENEQDDSDMFTKLLGSVEKHNNSLLEEPEIQTHSDMPDINGTGWHDYVMSQFAEGELEDGKYPNLFGLRRVAEVLLGPVIQSGPTHIVAPSSETTPGRATCVYTVVFDWNNSGTERAFSAVGGAYPGNTDDTYAIFPEAIAEARAEGRALRKALKLRVIAAEESPKLIHKKEVVEVVSTGENKDSDNITAVQLVFVRQKCKEMNIELDKLMEKCFSGKKLEEITRGQGKELIELLNKYQTNCKSSLDVPEDIKISS
jgi:hypothetical protein